MKGVLSCCPYHNFLLCGSNKQGCEDYKNNTNLDPDSLNLVCGASVADLAKKKNLEDYNALERDCSDLGWSFTRIEDALAHMESLNLQIVSPENRMSNTFQNLYPKTFFIPWDLSNHVLIKQGNYQLRGSEFHAKCPLSYLFSMMDPKKTGISSDSTLSRVGTLRHSLAMDPCDHGKYQKLISSNPEFKDRFNIPTTAWTEINVEYVLDTKNMTVETDSKVYPEEQNFRKYKHFFDFKGDLPSKLILRGTADCVLKLNNYDRTLVILDLKRYRHGAYEHTGSKFQFLSYALAIQQKLELDIDNFILISQHSPSEGESYSIRSPKYHVTLVKNNREFLNNSNLQNENFIDRLHNEMAIHYFVKQQLLENPELLREIRFSQEKITRRKDEKNKCESLFSGVPCILYESGYCEKMIDLLCSSENIENYLLDNVSF